MIEILHRYTKAVLHRHDGAYLGDADLRGADLSGANLSGTNLRGADLSGANLSGTNLRGADLSDANLRGADLRDANLSDANLRDANLRDANLRDANLRDADLRDADLRGADLRDANLRDADLRGADLRGADLRDANLRDADLRGVNNLELRISSQLSITPEGVLIGWKKCEGGVVVKLQIPAEAKRSNATGRKCRCQFADVLEVIGSDAGLSQHDGKTEYRVGQRVTCNEWCDDRWIECAGGIHFYITKAEAEAH